MRHSSGGVRIRALLDVVEQQFTLAVSRATAIIFGICRLPPRP
jgi:hypothetical protein